VPSPNPQQQPGCLLSRWGRCVALHLHALCPVAPEIWRYLSRVNVLRGIAAYVRSYHQYARHPHADPSFPLRFVKAYPQIYDRFRAAGELPRHYFLQDIWAARRVHTAGVAVHVDVGSRVDGMLGHCLSFCRVVMIDIRPLPMNVPHLEFQQGNATDLSSVPADSVASLSSLHAVEHFGLGRYGDPVDPQAYQQAIGELIRILAPGGNLYFSVPIGRQRLEFNAHRVFDPVTVRSLFAGLQLVEFAAIGDDGQLREQVRPDDYRGARYACGLFWFRKAGSAAPPADQ